MEPSYDTVRAAIERHEFRSWMGLPMDLRYSDVDSLFTRLSDACGVGFLGRAGHKTLFRMHLCEGYPHNLKIWFDGDRIRMIELRYPMLPYPASELVHHLGKPQAKVDYSAGAMPVAEGAWVYAGRGITVFLDIGHAVVMALGLFAPCTLKHYLDQLHPDSRMHELPIEEG